VLRVGVVAGVVCLMCDWIGRVKERERDKVVGMSVVRMGIKWAMVLVVGGALRYVYLHLNSQRFAIKGSPTAE